MRVAEIPGRRGDEFDASPVGRGFVMRMRLGRIIMAKYERYCQVDTAV